MKKLIITLALVIVATVGSFAYAYTTDTMAITTTAASSDFATVESNPDFDADYTLVGSVLGKLGNDTMFYITGNSDYTGDILISVTLANAEELSDEYLYWIARVSIRANDNSIISRQGIAKLVSLKEIEATFFVDYEDIAGKTVYAVLDGGSYSAFPFTILDGRDSDPLIYCVADFVMK